MRRASIGPWSNPRARYCTYMTECKSSWIAAARMCTKAFSCKDRPGNGNAQHARAQHMHDTQHACHIPHVTTCTMPSMPHTQHACHMWPLARLTCIAIHARYAICMPHVMCDCLHDAQHACTNDTRPHTMRASDRNRNVHHSHAVFCVCAIVWPQGAYGHPSAKPTHLYSNYRFIEDVCSKRTDPTSGVATPALVKRFIDASGQHRFTGLPKLHESQHYCERFGQAMAESFHRHAHEIKIAATLARGVTIDVDRDCTIVLYIAETY